jgi:hypothetical protein
MLYPPMRFRARVLRIALVSGLPASIGCAARPAPVTTPVLAPAPTEVTPDAPAARPPAGDYAALVRQVIANESGTTTANCSFERVDQRLRFGGHAASAIRPLPMPSEELEPQLARSVSVNVLTTYGRYGEAPGMLTLASFSASTPRRQAIALILTDQGVSLRGVDASVPMQDRLTREAAVQAAVLVQPATVFVAAEAKVPTPLVSELITALDSQRVPVALAVDLPVDASLPQSSASSAYRACPDGLSDSREAEGALAPNALATPLQELRTRAANCLNSADARGAAGGRLRLMFRVMPNGSVGEACISADETGDTKLLACILKETTSVRFPAPSPIGSADFELPLSLQPEHAPPAPLLCDSEL